MSQSQPQGRGCPVCFKRGAECKCGLTLMTHKLCLMENGDVLLRSDEDGAWSCPCSPLVEWVDPRRPVKRLLDATDAPELERRRDEAAARGLIHEATTARGALYFLVLHTVPTTFTQSADGSWQVLR